MHRSEFGVTELNTCGTKGRAIFVEDHASSAIGSWLARQQAPKLLGSCVELRLIRRLNQPFPFLWALFSGRWKWFVLLTIPAKRPDLALANSEGGDTIPAESEFSAEVFVGNRPTPEVWAAPSVKLTQSYSLSETRPRGNVGNTCEFD